MTTAAVLFVAPASSASAERLSDIFHEGNQAYFKGDYPRAISRYELLVDAGIEDPDVSHNLGVAHSRLEQYGHAIRWFERSLRQRHDDDQTARNLKSARAALGQRQAASRGEVLMDAAPPLFESLVRPVSKPTLAIAVLVANALFFLVLFLFQISRRDQVRLGLGIGAVLTGLVLALLATGLAIKHGAVAEGQPAIVLTREAAIREGPHHRAEPRTTALEGQRVRVVGRRGPWLRVRIRGHAEGWMRSSDVGAI